MGGHNNYFTKEGSNKIMGDGDLAVSKHCSFYQMYYICTYIMNMMRDGVH